LDRGQIAKGHVRLTVGSVQEQDRVSTTQDRYQSKVQLHGVSLLGMRQRLGDSMVTVDSACCRRFCDILLIALHGALGCSTCETRLEPDRSTVAVNGFVSLCELDCQFDSAILSILLL
jgi:hypothetical protein